MTKRGNHLLLLVFIIVALASACTQQRTPCYDPKIVSVAIGTYRIVDTAEGDTSLVDPAFYCLDTPLQFTINSRNKFSALLSPFVDSTRWVLVPNATRQDDTILDGTPPEFYDTLTFYHTRKMNFVSNACGYVYYYTLDGVKTTYNSLDSILIVNPSVDNNANTQHVKIYY